MVNILHYLQIVNPILNTLVTLGAVYWGIGRFFRKKHRNEKYMVAVRKEVMQSDGKVTLEITENEQIRTLIDENYNLKVQLSIRDKQIRLADLKLKKIHGKYYLQSAALVLLLFYRSFTNMLSSIFQRTVDKANQKKQEKDDGNKID